jgi:hypothetical protein
MLPMKISLGRVAFLCLALTLVGQARAFDTGHHYDLTREVLAEVGMSETSIKVCQVENWLVDYYSASPIASDVISREVHKLHSDNLFNRQAVTNYWDRYAVNAKNAFTEAARARNPKQVLALLGMSLHTVQDFYSHSNWAELQRASGADYATTTWFDATNRDNVKTGMSGLTGSRETPHGSYSDGMHHDGYNRPNWDRAYVLAYAGSRQWVNQVKLWVSEVDPSVWEQARAISLTSRQTDRLNSDLVAAYRLSEWVKDDREDGHWKGNGSGSRTDFYPFAAAWTGLTLDSIFVEDFKNRKWHQLLSGGQGGALDLSVNAPPPTPAPVILPLAIHKKAVFLRTVQVRDLNKVDSVVGIGGNADFFARVTINNQQFTETMQLDQATIRPSWTTIRFVDDTLTSVSVHYELWDEDSMRDDHLDIHSDTRFTDLDFFLNTNTHQLGGNGVEGVFDSPSRLWTSQGTSENRAELQFFITTRTLAKLPHAGKILISR